MLLPPFCDNDIRLPWPLWICEAILLMPCCVRLATLLFENMDPFGDWLTENVLDDPDETAGST